MTVVRNTLEPPGVGSVTIRLVAPAGWRNDGTSEVVEPWTVPVGSNGVWQVDLPPQSSYLVENTWYEVRQSGSTHYITVPDDGGPYNLFDLLIRPLPPSQGEPVGPTLADIVAAIAAHESGYPHGGSGIGTVRVPAVAGIDLSGHRVVTPRPDGELEYADNATPGHLHGPLMLTTGAVTAGAPTEVVAFGALVEPSWSWTAGDPLYLGQSGLLTHTPPASPGAVFLAQVGVATGTTSVWFDRHPSIILV